MDSESILEKCPNFCDCLSQEEKFKMYPLIKKKDDKIKHKLGESIMHDAESNKETVFFGNFQNIILKSLIHFKN